jgi:anti-sigma factor RsiW
MNSMLSSISDGHLPNGLLAQFLDDELSAAEAAKAECHLAQCSICSGRCAELRRVSSSFDEFIDSLRPAFEVSERQELASKLDRANGNVVTRRARTPMPRLGWWGLAAAAALTIGVLYLPSSGPGREGVQTALAVKEGTGAFEIDGETFISLPFSNPELPVNARRIVQMQVPVSSLEEAGIVVEPIANRVAQPDHSVLADVLLGLDGQPVAVHVVSFD